MSSYCDLRQKIRSERNVEKQLDFVREAVVLENARLAHVLEAEKQAKALAEHEVRSGSLTIQNLEERLERMSRDFEDISNSKEHLTNQLQGMNQELAGERQYREGLEHRLQTMLTNIEEERSSRLLNRSRIRFSIKMALVLIAGVGAAGLATFFVTKLVDRGTAFIGGHALGIVLVLWTLIVRWLGERTEDVRLWPPFMSFCKIARVLISLLVAALLFPLLYDLYKRYVIGTL